ncbi:MAG: hypothetical protein AB7S78_08675 [Candidatus Omnitrophota bacterium]
MSKIKTPLFVKILLSVFSFIFFLTILEVGLRVVGKIYYEYDEEYRTDETESAAESVGHVTDIIAVGDSFTHGGMVEAHETYTSHLRELFQRNQINHVKIHNQGICELNTHELVQRIPAMISKYHPKVVLLLAGATNRFNPWAYEAYAKKSKWSSLKNWFFELRVVKMARFIRISWAVDQSDGIEFQKKKLMLRNLKPTRSIFTRHDNYMGHLEHWEGIKTPQEYNYLEQAWHLFNTGESQKGIELLEETLKNKQVSPIEGALALVHFYYKTDNIDKAEDLLQKTYQMNQQSEQVYDGLAYYNFELANWHKKKLHYNKAIDHYLRAIAVDPDADYFFSELNKLYELQSYYDSRDIYQKLMTMKEENPLLSLSKNFTNNLNIYKDKQKWDSGIEQWIYDDLKSVAVTCQKKNIRLFVQLYPTDYMMANKVLRKIADEYHLPVIDHQAAFKGLEPKSKYFFDDDHCTNEGHKIMSETIYAVLKKENVFQM